MNDDVCEGVCVCICDDGVRSRRWQATGPSAPPYLTPPLSALPQATGSIGNDDVIDCGKPWCMPTPLQPSLWQELATASCEDPQGWFRKTPTVFGHTIKLLQKQKRCGRNLVNGACEAGHILGPGTRKYL